jgi:hypothetical protein
VLDTQGRGSSKMRSVAVGPFRKLQRSERLLRIGLRDSRPNQADAAHESVRRRKVIRQSVKVLVFTLLALGALLLPATANKGNNQERVKERRIEERRGEAVRLRALQLRSKNKGFARAMRDMEARGLRPVWEQSVTILSMEVETTAQSTPKSQLVRRVSYAPQTIIEGDTELTFVTYDNGNPETWEGLIYVRTSYDESTYEALFDTPGLDYNYWDVTWEIYYPSDGGDPQCAGGPCPILSRYESRPDQRARIVKAAYSPSLAVSAPLGFRGWVSRWWGCFKGSCGAVINSCSGPGRVPCVALGCTGAAIKCIFVH